MKIRKLFSSHRQWIKGTDARVAPPKGPLRPQATEPDSDDAQCWCLRGAVYRCYTNDEHEKVFSKLADSIGTLFPRRLNKLGPTIFIDPSNLVVRFNDHHRTNFADVLKVVRHAKV